MENGMSSVSTSGSMQRKVDVSFTFVPTSIHVVVGHHCFNECAIESAMVPLSPRARIQGKYAGSRISTATFYTFCLSSTVEWGRCKHCLRSSLL